MYVVFVAEKKHRYCPLESVSLYTEALVINNMIRIQKPSLSHNVFTNDVYWNLIASRIVNERNGK